jgi:hypothetical protein
MADVDMQDAPPAVKETKDTAKAESSADNKKPRFEVKKVRRIQVVPRF